MGLKPLISTPQYGTESRILGAISGLSRRSEGEPRESHGRQEARCLWRQQDHAAAAAHVVRPSAAQEVMEVNGNQVGVKGAYWDGRQTDEETVSFLEGRVLLEGLAGSPHELCLHNTLGVGRIGWCLFSEPGSAI